MSDLPHWVVGAVVVSCVLGLVASAVVFLVWFVRTLNRIADKEGRS